MEGTEKIKVFVWVIKGKTCCICHADNKQCSRHCQRDTVTRDKFESWESTFRRDRYGK